MKRAGFIASAILIIILGVFITQSNRLAKNTQRKQAPAAGQVKNDLTLVIDFGEGNQKKATLPFEEKRTAFSLLKEVAEAESINLETKQYDFGAFVKSIAGKESSAEMAWIYFINGESGNTAADKAVLKPGDRVDWKYTKPSQN